MVIIACPNCDAHYKLPDAVVARGARMKCAACDHRWVPAAPVETPAAPPATSEADEEAAFVAVQEQISARWADADRPGAAAQLPADSTMAGDAAAHDDSDDAADETENAEGENGDEDDGEHGGEHDDGDADRRPAMVRTLVAGLAGLALAIVAAGLWVGRVELSGIPYVGEALARLSPVMPLEISVIGTTTRLPSGRLLLDVRGVIRNTGSVTADVPDLRATLSGPGGTALRWTITPDVRRLPAGTETEYSSTVTGFAPDAGHVAITPARPRLF